MKCSVFIATSADGHIATPNGDVDWLHSAGNLDADMGDNPDMGFETFMQSIDCMIMGRKSMEMIDRMNLPPDHWPYGDIPVIVLSRSLKIPPKNLADKIELYAGDIPHLIKSLASRGIQHAYIDGGATIRAFLDLKLINEMTITQAPVILGKGISLFGGVNHRVKLKQASVIRFPNDFVQFNYLVSYED